MLLLAGRHGERYVSAMAADLYLDSNVFDHLAKAGMPGIPVSIEESRRFRARVAAGNLRILLSVHNLEEALGLVVRDYAGAKALLRSILDLAEPFRIFKEPRILMEEAVQAAVAASEPPDPFIQDPTALLNPLQLALQDPAFDDSELKDVAQQTAEQIEGFRESMREAQRETRSELRRQLGTGSVIPFPEFVGIASLDIAKDLVTRVASDADPSAAARLLGFPFARTYIEGSCSLLYAQLFEKHVP